VNINQIRYSPNPLTEPQIALMRSAVEKDFIQPFIDGLDEILRLINEKLSSLLQSFGHNLNATLILVSSNDSLFLGSEPEIWLKINYLGIDNFNFLDRGGWQTFYDHLDLLNEARLSALAISIYLAAILSYSTEGMAYKILFLDDVFVGLDNTNRLPLLDILNREFPSYQIFITTYDRYWFEVAKEHLDEKKWKTAELYVRQVRNDDGEIIREEPLLLPTKGNVERATAYANLHDYPAAGNYLRKECERLLKQKLPPQYRIALDGSEINTLEALINQLEKYYEDCQIDISREAIGTSLKVAKKAILNPASHDDLRSPLYRGELEKVFDLVAKLAHLPPLHKKTVALKWDFICLKIVEHDYFIGCELTSDLVLVNWAETSHYVDFKVIVKGFKQGSTDWVLIKVGIERTLREVTFGIFKSLKLPIPDSFDENTAFNLANGVSLEELKSKF
jgi:hypothetical protein